MLRLDSLRLALALIAIVSLLAGCKTTNAPDGAAQDPVEQEARAPEPEPTPKPSVRESTKPNGRWRKLRVSGDRDAELEMQIRQLEAIGYASGTKTAPSSVGVTVYDSERAQPGLNFYTSGQKAEAALIDMEGRLVHRWEYDFWDVWPDHHVNPAVDQTRYWRRAHLFENGDILAIYEGLGLIKLDKDSKLLWARRNGAHHDLHVLPNGDIAVLARKARAIKDPQPMRVILEDFVVVLGPRGRTKARTSLLEAFERSRKYGHIWKTSERQSGDIFHTNSIEVLDGRFTDRNPALAKGNYLLSSRILSTVFVVDPRQNRVVWALRADFKAQHDAQMLASGGLMLLDNQGREQASAVQIFDPATGKLNWEFRATDERPFYTHSCGTAQRLSNGNTLVTESDNGRAFELAADDESIVWEYYSPHRAGENDEYVATLFSLERIPPSFPTHWAASAGSD